MGVFFDDTIRVNDRLTLNVGVRFDRNTARTTDVDVLDQQGNPTGETVAGRDLYTWNAIAPRVGFNLKLTADGKTVLRGHYGRYYRGIVTAEYSNSIGAPPTRRAPEPTISRPGTFIDPEVVAVQPRTSASIRTTRTPTPTSSWPAWSASSCQDLGLSLHYINKRARRSSAWEDLVGQYEDVTDLRRRGRRGHRDSPWWSNACSPTPPTASTSCRTATT